MFAGVCLAGVAARVLGGTWKTLSRARASLVFIRTIGSVTASVALAAAGVAPIGLPSLLLGNELLILGGVALVVGAWFLAHRHGRLRAMVDANKNRVDDRLEPKGDETQPR